MAGRTARLHQEIGFFLEQFQPDLDALQYMYHRYRRIAALSNSCHCWPSTRCEPKGKPATTPMAGPRAGSGTLAASHGNRSTWATRGGRPLVRAAECNPNNFARYKAGCLLADAGQLDDSRNTWRGGALASPTTCRPAATGRRQAILDPTADARKPAIPAIPRGDYHEARPCPGRARCR